MPTNSAWYERAACWLCCLGAMFAASPDAPAADDAAIQAKLKALEPEFGRDVRLLLVRYCHDCHAGDTVEADIDFASFPTLTEVRKQPQVWQKVAEMLDSAQMPPPDAPQPSDADRQHLQRWVREYLTVEATARAGDPGPVVLRRLSNAEYTYTVRELTGVDSLDPAREFPVDSAAGEGFTNVGQALVMSPALLTKYFDAAKEIAAHAVLLPDGLRFSRHTTRRDWTNEDLDRIRAFYGRYAGEGGGSAVNLQGIQFSTNQGGRLPIERYLEATFIERGALTSGRKTLEQIATERGLSAKYLTSLWRVLTDDAPGGVLLDRLRSDWRTAQPGDAPKLTAFLAEWQAALWKFNTVGHIGRQGGPPSWLEAVSPLATRQEFRVPLPVTGDDVVLSLVAGDAGDGPDGDVIVWEQPRFVAPGRPDLLLRDVGRMARALAVRREQFIAQAARCLTAAAEAAAAATPLDTAALAKKHDVDAESLAAWLDYLGIGASGDVPLGTPITRRLESASGYDFIKGWVGDDALSVVANASDQHVRIPGNMLPHSVAVHPTPTLAVAVGWRSPAAATVRITGRVQHAHPECGNGVTWEVELRRGNTRQRVAAGISQGAKVIPIEALPPLAVRAGDVVSLVIGPRDGNHSCDLTAIDLTIDNGERTWSLARDVSPDILAGNPHSGVWHFYSEPASGAATHVIPTGSLLAKWQATAANEERQQLAQDLERLLREGPTGLPADAPDAVLHRQLTSLGGPLMAAARRTLSANLPEDGPSPKSPYGLDAARFGRDLSGGAIDPGSLCVQGPMALDIRLPADLVAGAEFVTTGTLHPAAGREGSVQLRVQTGAAEIQGLTASLPVLVADGSDKRQRLVAAFDRFRNLFPAALCYTKIVPVDEVVTLSLYYREDEPLKRLMLNDREAAELDRLWDELLYVAREPLEMVTAFEQISEFATQDRPDLVKSFEPLREPIHRRAEAFRKRLVDTEPAHWDAVLTLAERAYRRPLTDADRSELRRLYAQLRREDLSHDEAIRLTLARILVSPGFLYRTETPPPGPAAGPVSDWELAARLSYFLWSSPPDDELRALAAAGKLSDPDTLAAQARRMLRDDKTRRLAIEFGCRWLHVHGFDALDEKSERHFPTFGELRGAMYEESIQVLTDFFQRDGSLLDLIAADHTFLNEALARHYGIPNVTGPEWRRVDGVGQHHRGGILAQAAVLAKQSGASRTSPILRGNWVSEVLLGEKLPRPPKNVPQLADEVPDGLTERQLIERHSRDAACAKCHVRIDPFGFALEQFDAIGRYRDRAAGDLPIDVRTALPDGTEIDGLGGLQDYLRNRRRDAFVRQFCRKLLGYALGRSVLLSDELLLAEMQTVLKKQDFRIGPVVETIVLSRQFREIRGRDVADDP